MELIEFSSTVNSGSADYSKITVYLDSDIEFTDGLSLRILCLLEVIMAVSMVFLMVRETQSKTSLKWDYNFSGLFGHSWGLTIRNVVMDSSCTIKQNSQSYIGSIIGSCTSYKRPCIIENCVNKVDISRGGSMGGIAGYVYGNYKHKGNSYIKKTAQIMVELNILARSIYQLLTWEVLLGRHGRLLWRAALTMAMFSLM